MTSMAGDAVARRLDCKTVGVISTNEQGRESSPDKTSP